MRSSSRRSFAVQAMSTIAGVWIGMSTGGIVAWLSGCGSKRATEAPPPPHPPPPAPPTIVMVAEPEPNEFDPEPVPTATLAVDPAVDPSVDPEEAPDAGVEEQPVFPVVKYGGPPFIDPIPEVRPMYGGPFPDMPEIGPKYGGMMRPKYGGTRGPKGSRY